MSVIPNIIVSVSGLPKSGKNYFAYTFPDPIKVYCFNGGAEFVKSLFSKKQIDVHNFRLPIVDSTTMEWALPVWREFYQEYKADIEKEKYLTYVLDTGTEVENMCQQAVLEDLQQDKPTKEKLGTTEFLFRNLQMKALFDRARDSGANLVVLNYLKEKWIKVPGEKTAQNTGELILDGWQKTETQADINLELRVRMKEAKGKKKQVTVATIKSLRFGRDHVGEEFEDLTYDDLIALLFGAE